VKNGEWYARELMACVVTVTHLCANDCNTGANVSMVHDGHIAGDSISKLRMAIGHKSNIDVRSVGVL
jgi:hypothetical protein